LRDPRKEVSDEEYQVSIAFEEEDLSPPIEERVSIGEHMNNYTKLLADIVNVDVEIEKRTRHDSSEFSS